MWAANCGQANRLILRVVSGTLVNVTKSSIWKVCWTSNYDNSIPKEV